MDNPWAILSPWSETIGKFVNDPKTNWRDFFNPQIILNYSPMEAHVLSRAGSYGSQLGTLIDVIDILKRKIPIESLNEADQDTLKAFDELRDNAKKAVNEFRGLGSADTIVAATKALQLRDRVGFNNLRDQLKAVFEGADSTHS